MIRKSRLPRYSVSSEMASRRSMLPRTLTSSRLSSSISQHACKTSRREYFYLCSSAHTPTNASHGRRNAATQLCRLIKDFEKEARAENLPAQELTNRKRAMVQELNNFITQKKDRSSALSAKAELLAESSSPGPQKPLTGASLSSLHVMTIFILAAHCRCTSSQPYSVKDCDAAVPCTRNA